MAPSEPVVRAEGARAFIEFTGPGAAELSRLVKYFLSAQAMYRVEYLAKYETTTLKVYDSE